MSILFLICFILVSSFLFPVSSHAQCPVCVVTVGGGMLIAKKLGIDDLLVSIWISALNVALSFWLAPKIKIKFLNNPHIFTIIMFLTTLYYFQFTGQIGHDTNKLLGVDKILFGQTLGLLAMTLANHSYQFIKKKRGSTPFPYAKVVFPLGTVLLVTLVFKIVFNL